MFLKMYGWDYLLAEGAHNHNEVFLSLEEALITPLDAKPDWVHIAILDINKFTVVASYRDGKWTSDDPQLLELVEKLFTMVGSQMDEEDWDEFDEEFAEEEARLHIVCNSFMEQLSLKDSYSGTPASFYENLVRKHAEELSKAKFKGE